MGNDARWEAGSTQKAGEPRNNNYMDKHDAFLIMFKSLLKR